MLFHLLYDVIAKLEGMGFLRVFRYTSTRIIAAAITSLLISFVLGPWFIERLKHRQIGQQIREDGPDHQHKSGTPTMGGSLVLFAMVTATLLWCDLENRFVWLAMVVTVGFGAIGFADDYLKVSKKNTKGISGKLRLLLEFVICGAVLYYFFSSDMMVEATRLQLQLPFTNFATGSIHLPLWFYVGFGSVVIVGTANAVNLTDGLDGLAIGPIIINSGTFLILAYLAGAATTLVVMVGGEVRHETIADYLHVAHLPGSQELAIFCAGMFGAGIGFLWYNTYPASVFMGDVGSLSLGGALGILAVLTKNELVLLIVGGLFVVEALSVIIQVGSYKLRNKKRVFLMAPIHHHYEKKGWEEPKIIVRFWLISVLLALLALGTLKMR